MNYVNLRGSLLQQVRFVGCRIDELDLSGARLDSVVFQSSSVSRLVLNGAHCNNVDLTGAGLEAIDGISGLRGASVSWSQLQSLAPALAAHLGIYIVDADETAVS